MSYNRRSFLAAAVGTAASLASGAGARGAELPDSSKSALDRLAAGNARFVADRAVCPPLTARRLELAEGQSPFAIVVSCSDSRVPVETIFDQTPGNIFGVRLAGNFIDTSGLGSIEYSVAVLKSSLILVLGHTHCGAVKATIGYVKDRKKQPGSIQSLVDAILPAATATKGDPGDWLENATLRNVQDGVTAIRARSPIVAAAIASGTLAVAGGIYDLHSGRVRIAR